MSQTSQGKGTRGTRDEKKNWETLEKENGIRSKLTQIWKYGIDRSNNEKENFGRAAALNVGQLWLLLSLPIAEM
jgi:hypothetical protein